MSLLRLLDSPLVFCVVVDVVDDDVVAVVAAVALFGRFRRIFSTWPRVHVPARFAPVLTCCKRRLNTAVISNTDIVRGPRCSLGCKRRCTDLIIYVNVQFALIFPLVARQFVVRLHQRRHFSRLYRSFPFSTIWTFDVGSIGCTQFLVSLFDDLLLC